MRDQVVVITGAASGIGAALAQRLAQEGTRLALLDRAQAGVEALAKTLEGQGVQALAVGCDVTDPDDCQLAIDTVVDAFGGVDVLVNNAGITHLGRFRDTDPSVLRKVMDVNFFGAVYCTKAALPSLLERRGQIIVLSSVAGIGPLVGRTGYAASKHALHGFFDSLRAEHREDGLRVLLVCPSFVATAIGDHALGTDGGMAPPEARTGVRSPGRPEDLAEAIVAAAKRGHRLLLWPREAVLAHWIARLSPALYEWLMARRTGSG